MRICARCLGASIGHSVSLVLFLMGYLPSLWIASAFIIIMMVDWSFQKYLDIESTNFRRLFTGIAGGIGVGTIIWTAFSLVEHFIFS